MSYLLPKILFEVTPEIKIKYGSLPHQKSLFTTESNKTWLTYRTRSLDEYRAKYDGDSDQIQGGSVAAVIQVAYRRYGFELTISNGRQEIIKILNELRQNAYMTTPGKYIPLLCRDYVRPESNLEYSDRLGVITELEELGGYIYLQGREARVGKGVRIVFMCV